MTIATHPVQGIRFTGGLSIAILSVLFGGGTARAELPLPVFPECGEADRPDLCPEDLDEDWRLISYIPASARDSVREAELEMGSGCHADEAWQTTTGRWDVVVAVLDSGIDWDDGDLVAKIHLDTGELPFPQDADGVEAEDHDFDGNGLVNIDDWVEDPRVDVTAGVDAADDRLDASDLIHTAWGEDWDGVDNDGDGYVDEIAGWDFFGNDNDPFSDNDKGFGLHGTGVAESAVAEGGDASSGRIGVCPNCALLPVRVGDTFISDGVRLGRAVAFATDAGASVLAMAVGGISHPRLVQEALAYAHDSGVTVVAAAGDENAYHRNFPAVAPETLFVHSIRSDSMNEDGTPYSYLNFYNCNNYGPRTVLSAASSACATGAVAVTTGAAGLVVSAARDAGLELSAGEVYQLLIGGADDIWLTEEEVEEAGTYPSAEGWDPFYGYGRLNVGRAVEQVAEGAIPPVVEIREPAWFEPISLDRAHAVPVTARISAERTSGFSWTLEVGTGWEPDSRPDSWIEVNAGSATEPVDGYQGSVALADLAGELGGLVEEAEEEEGVLGRVERTHRPAVTVRIVVEDDEGRMARTRRTFFVIDDPDLKDGFPVDLGSSGESSPQVVDLVPEEAQELVRQELVIATSQGAVHVLDGEGREVAPYPVWTEPVAALQDHADAPAYTEGGVPDTTREALLATVAVGDLEGDGVPEIVAASYEGGVYAWSEGELVSGFPVWSVGREPEELDADHTWDQGFLSSPTLEDLDADGTLEILVAGLDGRLYVLDAEGNDWGPYPLELCEPSQCGEKGFRLINSPSVGDVDDDGRMEIALGTNETLGDGEEAVAFLLDAATGEHEPGWPVTTRALVSEADLIPVIGEGHPASLPLADLDGDGRSEMANPIMFGSTGILDAEGQVVLDLAYGGDAFGTDANSTEPGMVQMAANGAFGDMNGDGTPDLVMGCVGSYYLVALVISSHFDFQHPVAGWDGATGGFLPGWPRQVEDVQFLTAPVIADVSGDGRPEAIVGSGGSLLHAWDAEGVQAEGWPHFTGAWLMASPAVGDIDGDGYLDVVAVGREGYLFAWTTRGRADQEIQWASIFHDPRNTGNLATALPVLAGPPDPDTGQAAAGAGCGCGIGRLSPLHRGLWGPLVLLLLVPVRRRASGVTAPARSNPMSSGVPVRNGALSHRNENGGRWSSRFCRLWS